MLVERLQDFLNVVLVFKKKNHEAKKKKIYEKQYHRPTLVFSKKGQILEHFTQHKSPFSDE